MPAANIPATHGDHLRAFPHGVLARPAGRRYGQQTELLVIATSGDDTLSRLRAGEATSAALLAATGLGLATCPLSQPLEIADTRRQVRDGVLASSAEPQLVIRLGWAPTTAEPLPTTPRRDVADRRPLAPAFPAVPALIPGHRAATPASGPAYRTVGWLCLPPRRRRSR